MLLGQPGGRKGKKAQRGFVAMALEFGHELCVLPTCQHVSVKAPSHVRMLHVRLLPDQQNFSPAGVAILEIWYELLLGILKLTQVYLVRLWLSGRWRDIIVDDQLPCVGNGVGTCATQDRATQRPVRHAQRRKSCASKRYRQLAYCSTRRCVGLRHWTPPPRFLALRAFVHFECC